MSDASLTRNSYLTALIVTLSVLILLLIFQYGLDHPLTWQSYFFTLTVSFAASYFASNYFFGRFVYQKIKLIYKMIYRMKSPVRESQRKRISNDIISHIESEVKNWSELNRREIDELRQKEIYRKDIRVTKKGISQA